MAYSYPFYQILTILGMVLLLMSTPFHLNMKGASTWPFIFWLFIWCILATVGSIVWRDRLEIISPTWCDISNKLWIGSTFGVISSTVAINRRVNRITRSRSLMTERRRDLVIDLLLGVGVPVLLMIFHIVVQGHRGNIMESAGCRPSIANVTVAYPLIFMWSPFLSFVAAVYACLSFIAFVRLRRRNNIDEFFSSGYSITKDHYLRLMCFSLIPPMIMVPLTFFNLTVNIKHGPFPWISWEDTKSNFNRFDLYPVSAMEADPESYACFLIELWSCTGCCYLFFIFLGLNPEQRRQYRRWFFIILRPIGIKPAPDSPSVWNRLFSRSTTTTLTPTPFTISGTTASTSMSSMPHRQKGTLDPTDIALVERENFGFNDRKRAVREETSNPREGGLNATAVTRGDHKDPPGRRKDEKEKENPIV